ncbi:hypothetical protein BWQ96_04441 [Gracilariopsis chorda]|uniref:Uncharacterized protein n=1 Tax=Gracilariopsis chorda TaxID=448386 RepID=A0A2V3IUH6_9FLOR|nr:hypothetical protein BWQ96_04441 [Gracilariopsis chorda]|eukprot:PXF45774.1 hypothetical protein BWQ96_04441 [Gracilariopsis chorda]
MPNCNGEDERFNTLYEVNCFTVCSFCQARPEIIGGCLFTDASFGKSDGLASQLGVLVALRDGNGNTNILSYGSKKSERVTRSFMTAELLAVVHGYDQAYIAKYMLEEMLQRKIPIAAYIVSRKVFNSVTKQRSTSEKRLEIDMAGKQE